MSNHVAYRPRLLPQESSDAVSHGLHRHFGTDAKVKSTANCSACQQDAESGRFDEHGVRSPRASP